MEILGHVQEVEGEAEGTGSAQGLSPLPASAYQEVSQERARLFMETGGDRTRGNGSSCDMESSDTWIFISNFKITRVITQWNRALG